MSRLRGPTFLAILAAACMVITSIFVLATRPTYLTLIIMKAATPLMQHQAVRIPAATMPTKD